MFTVTIQRQSDYATKSKSFDTRAQADSIVAQAIAKAHKVIDDSEVYTGEPLRRSVKLASQSTTYVVNLYRY